MTVAPLQLPTWRDAPMVDFRPLQEIGNAIGDYRQRAALADALPGMLTGGNSLATLGQPQPAPAAPVAPIASTGGPDAYADATKSVESGGRYDLQGPVIAKGAYAGDRALGAYQIMGKNLPQWSREVVGREVSPQEFLSSPALQDQIYQAKFGQLVAKYGPEGAAKAWFAGERGMNDPDRKDQLGTTVSEYARRFNAALPQGAMAFSGQPAPANPLANGVPGKVYGQDEASPLDAAPYPAGPVGAPSGAPGAPLATDLSAQSRMPQGAAPGAVQPNAGGIPPQTIERLQAMIRAGGAAQTMAMALIQKYVAPQYGFQTLPDGTVVRTNPTSGTVEPIYSAQKPEVKQTGEDMFGTKVFSQVYPDGRIVPIGPNGQPQSPGAPAASPGGATGVDSSLKGEDYLKQFPAEVQTAVRDYVAGNSTPTGNPRKGYTETIKRIAGKYAQDIGTTADDTTFNSRREMRNQLSRGTPGSLGGQLTFAGTALAHLAEVGEKAAELDNSNGLGIAPVGHLVNRVQAMGNEQSAKMTGVEGAVQHYGQEITKYYTGSPGGESERSRFLNTMSTIKTPKEIAEAIRTERDLVPGRLMQTYDQIVERLGQTEADRYLQRARLGQVIPRINRALAKLDPAGPEAKAIAAGAGDSVVLPNERTPAQQPSPQQRATAPGGLQPGMVVIQNGVRFQIQPDGSGKAIP